MDQCLSEQKNLPEAFIKQVKQGLEHLYDFPYLQRHPLARMGESIAEHPGETPGQGLRRELVAAIETLNPGTDIPFRAPHARSYNLLLLHYVEGMTVQESAHELGVSRRQAHRDLRRGEESVAAVLWARRPPPPSPEPRATELSSVQAEMARLETRARPVDVCALLQRAQDAVERMASKRGVQLHFECPLEATLVSTDPVIARQVLVNTLSLTVAQAQPGTLHVALAIGAEPASVTLYYTPEPDAPDILVANRVVTQLADRLGWTVRQEDRPGGTRAIVVLITDHCPTVLVIDDNEGLVELLEDYLTGHACRVRAATSSPKGLRLAQETVPDAVVLDLMMPEMDGWELLQRLRNHPQTASIPVIICSVINNPDLAYSLGASLFLPKPVSRDDVLNALRQLNVV